MLRHTSTILLFASLLFVFSSCAAGDALQGRAWQEKAYLLDLGVSPENISFDRGTFAYALWGGQDSCQITAVCGDGYSLTINGNSHASGEAFTLSGVLGSSMVTIEVSAPGKQPSTYTVTYMYYPPAQDARLASLQVSPGTLNPVFNAAVSNYSLAVNTNTLTVTATTAQGGATLTINGQSATSGSPCQISNVLIGTNTFPVTVVSQDGSMTNTTRLHVDFSWTLSFTSNNYDFNGGIGDLRSYILSAAGAPSYTATTNTTITGVLTAKGIYLHGTAQSSFFVQDQNAGMCIYTSDGTDLEVGTQISIHVTEVKHNYGLPVISQFDTVTRVGGPYKLYYKDGYNNNEDLNKVCRLVDATITTQPNNDNFFVGSFNGADQSKGDDYPHFHPNLEYLDEFELGRTANFLGVAVYSYSLYRLEIPSSKFIQ